MKKFGLSILIFAGAIFSAHANIEDDLQSASIGYMITDLKSGNTVADYNSDKLLVPASILKTVTVAAALDRLSDDFRYTTGIFSDGIICNDTITGNLYIEGSGDPTLDSNLINAIKNYPISHVRGNLTTNAQCPEIIHIWMVEDIGTDYGVGWCHLNYKNNEILMNEECHASDLDAILADISFDLSLSDITVGKEEISTDSARILIATIQSPRLIELCSELMHKSINLYAEAVGRALSVERNASDGLKTVKEYLLNLGCSESSFRLKDFCGLARTNLISPRALINVLSSNARNKSFVSTFPAEGKEGTVKRLLSKTPLSGRIVAKSGSMDGILAYAGYKLDSTGKPSHAFVIMVNNAIIPTSSLRMQIEKWFMKYFS
ncbi:MAG: D-alanyl-D-alanine carboxypeptidase [Muribaculaceae bacterium]|nr:D-alanyl-D-alanine carboxypeptidase [Muribaculaceae bacterium]